MVIYADVLFIVNFFITFLLLEITAKLTKRDAKIGRLVASSAAGGAYALILLVDLPAGISLLSKAAAATLLMLIAFRFYRVRSFFLTLGIFLFANFVFLGIIIGICLLSETAPIAVRNQTVYFNIGARGLLLCAFIAYVLSCIIVRLYNRRLSSKQLYTLVIENNGKRAVLLALSDTGNRLREPFSGDPVIVADAQKLDGMYQESKLRLIPSSTVQASGFLKAFKPERVIFSTAKGREVCDRLYVALSEEFNGEYSAVINPEILSI